MNTTFRPLVEFAVLIMLMLTACSKQEQHTSFTQEQILTEQEALKEFAIILSDAIADNEEMRAFLKDEALKEFDNDYDVFYPFIKGHLFSSGKTFRQELLSHEKYDNQLSIIETTIPKLTVLVPDFTWIDSNCFSVHNWDTTIEYVAVGFDDDGFQHPLFYNGKPAGSLPLSAFPSFPVIIVKNNERMCATATKGGEIEYSFADPAFIGKEETKALWGSTAEYYTNPTPGEDLFSQTENFIKHNELNNISPETIRAFNEFSTGSTNGVQRDYVYYNMTALNPTNGSLNTFTRDMLYRFRLTPNALFFIADNVTDEKGPTEDPNLAKPLETGRGDRPDFNNAIPRLWGNGKFEMRIAYFQSHPGSGTSCVGSHVLSIAPNEIMYVEKCYRTFQWNVFGNNWSSYTITTSDIQSKWYYPGDKYNPLPFIGSSWNLSQDSSNLFMRIQEYDPDQSVTRTKEHYYKQSSSVNANASVEVPVNVVKIGLGVSGSYGEESYYKDSYSYTTSATSDDLDDCEINYSDNYIIASTIHNGENGYILKAYGNEYFSVSFIPVDTRNEYKIQQFLLGRKNRNN